MGSTATGSAEAFWRGHVEAWQASGQSRGDYCAAQGLSRKTFGWWAWRLDRTRRSVEMESRDGRFLAVEVAGTSRGYRVADHRQGSGRAHRDRFARWRRGAGRDRF